MFIWKDHTTAYMLGLDVSGNVCIKTLVFINGWS